MTRKLSCNFCRTVFLNLGQVYTAHSKSWYHMMIGGDKLSWKMHEGSFPPVQALKKHLTFCHCQWQSYNVTTRHVV